MSDCKHPHLTFEDGEQYVRCIDCDYYWSAVSKKGGPPDYTAIQRQHAVDPTRHSKWMLPRDKKEEKKKVSKTELRKCNCCGSDTTQKPLSKSEAKRDGVPEGYVLCWECLR